MINLYDFTAQRLDGSEQRLSDYAGNVTLIVNTASKCGLTPQYEGLEDLYIDYAEHGLSILGFPCNQFGLQEPGNAEQIAEFCDLNFGVSFPLFDKVHVNGSKTHPLYAWLKAEQPGFLTSAIKWNFTKFLVSRDGQAVGRFAPTAKPESLTEAIEEQLAKPVPQQRPSRSG